MIGVSATALAPAAVGAADLDQVTPEMFGAKGDGHTNDTEAFVAMSARVNKRGGGTIILRPVTYLVGMQRQGPGGKDPSFDASDIIHLINCRLPITIRGNGATMRCAPGMRYGRFNARSGQPLPDPGQIDLSDRAVPYNGMIFVENCSGTVDIRDIELDGNLRTMWIGGKAARNGWQAGGTGIRLHQNSGPERLSRIHSHHHPQDGMMLTPRSDRSGATVVTDVVCDYNGRQGCSITGGRNFQFERCAFRHTGKAVLRAPSSPGAGVDIEAEHPPIRNVRFSDCEFSDNTGFGIDSGGGDSADISFSDCKFVGTTNLAAWPDSPLMRFSNCLFVGSINHAHGDADPARATQFTNCTFSDDPRLTPNGKIFLGPSTLRFIAILRDSPNVRFNHCHFRLTHDGLLPLSESNVIYVNCDMSQRSPTPSGPLGTYLGTNIIAGNAQLTGSIIRGTVILNGRMLRRSE